MRKVVLSLALVLGLAATASAALTVTVGHYSVLPGTLTVNIPVSLTGPDLISQTNINVSLVPSNALPGDLGGNVPTPTITWLGAPSDVAQNFMSTTTHLFGDAGSDAYDVFVFENLATPSSPIGTGAGGAGANILINLVVNLTGFENLAGTTWKIVMGADNANGSTDFANLSGGIAATVTDGSVTIVPEPSTIMLGLFAATGLGVVALRKRRARRA